MRSGKYYICNDIVNDLHLRGWGSYAVKQGIHSCMILPIRKEGEVIGTINLYATELDFLGETEIDLLVELTSDISFALDLFQKAEHHKETEELVIKNEKHFRSLIKKSADMITLVTAQGKLIYASPAVTKILGYTLEELLEKPDYEFIHPDDIELFNKLRAELLKNPGDSFSNEQRLLHKDGRYIKITGKSDLDYLNLQIADNGIGIASVYQNKIFEMFFRVSGEREGSGIGLYIVKETITKLGGSIMVESHEHEGTIFIICLKNFYTASHSMYRDELLIK